MTLLRVQLVFLAALSAMLAGCGNSSQEEVGTALLVAASVGPQAWLAAQLGGKHVKAIAVVQPGDDPHSYQPTDAQVTQVRRAAAYLRTGVPLEHGPWFEALSSVANGPRMVDLRQGIALRQDDDEPGEAGGDQGTDPHVWLSPRLLVKQAEMIAGILAQIDPAHASDYEKALDNFRDRAMAVDAEVRQILGPYKGRRFYVFHPAWGYFADEYGLEQVAVEVHGQQPDDRHLTEILRQAKQDGARVLFTQPRVAAHTAAALAAAAGLTVQPLDDLTPDALAQIRVAAKAIAQSYE